MSAHGVDRFDGFYLFNPFAENLYEGGDCIDRRVELSSRRLSGTRRASSGRCGARRSERPS